MPKLCAIEAIELMSDWADQSDYHTPEAFAQFIFNEKGIEIGSDFLTVEEAMKAFIAEHVG